MSLRSHSIVIFLDRNGFLLYQDLLSNIWQFPFSEDLVLHLEVINKDQLVSIIWNFIGKNKLMPSSVILVLSDSVVFNKDLAGEKEGQMAQEAEELKIQQFLENVPFEEPLAKVIGKTRLVVTNKELLEAIVLPFKKLGCTLEAVVPSFVYENKIDFSQGLSPDSAKIILKNSDLLKIANMLVGQKEIEVKKEQVETTEDQDQENPSAEKPKNTRQIVLIVMFIFLLIVLAVVYFTVSNSNDTPAAPNTSSSQSPNVPVSALTPTMAAEPTTNAVASPSAINLSGIKTTIVVNSETEAVGNILKRRLEQLDISNVTLSVAASSNPARSSILFSKTIGNEEKRLIAEEVRKILTDVYIQDSQTLEDLSLSIIVGSAL